MYAYGGFDRSSLFGTMAMKLVWINIGVFVIQIIVEAIAPQIMKWFMLTPYYVVRGCLWQLVTYMFLHGGGWHLISNVIGLYFFGPDIEEIHGRRWFLRFYLSCGIGAGVLITLIGLVSSHSYEIPTLGASGAIFGVLAAFAFHFPERQVYLMGIIPVPALLLVVLFGLLEFSSLGQMDGISHIGHIGGLLVGIGYMFATMRPQWFAKPLQPFKRFWQRITRPRPNITVVPSPTKKATPLDLEQEKRRMDELLEKVARQGINSLTKTEREFLDSISRKI